MNTPQHTFMPQSVAICGVGLLGGSIGLALKASGFKGRVTGLSSEGSIATALSLGCIDEGRPYEKLDEVVRTTDCLFLCSPIHAIISTIERLGTFSLPEGCIITDVGSTKGAVMAAAQRCLPRHVHFIGGHPMAGSEKRGPSASDPYLFQNAIYVLTPAPDTPRDVTDGFAGFLDAFLGCRHMVLDPGVHDTIAATVSHMPHLLAVALVNVAATMDRSVPGTLSLAAGGFRDMTRIASAPYAMWHDILATNRERIVPLIDAFTAELAAMKERLSADALKDDFDAAAQTRAKLSSSSKGFIQSPHDVHVVVKDQPGMIALMANACAKENINIKDIEVLKVRENEACTIRLAFETREIASAAVGLLRKLGLTAWERE